MENEKLRGKERGKEKNGFNNVRKKMERVEKLHVENKKMHI